MKHVRSTFSETIGLLAEFFGDHCSLSREGRNKDAEHKGIGLLAIANIVILIAKVFSGSSHPDLAHKICDRFDIDFIIH